MNLPEFAVRRPITIFMLFIAVVLFGLLALMRLPVDLMPSFEFPMVSVVTLYPGAGSEDIETNVTERFSASDFEGVSVQPMIDRSGYELILGSSIDPQFGPVILFGQGGTAVELIGDTSLELPPLTPRLAHELMGRTRVHRLLQGYRNRRPVDLDAVEHRLQLVDVTGP